MKTTATYVFLLLMLGAAWHMVHYYPLLPDTVASHYGISGQPDGWTSRQSFVGIYAGTVALLGGMFLALAAALPKLPVSWINLPNRDYWLDPERRQESVATIAATLTWLGSATIAFIIAVMHLVFLVNLGQRPGLGTIFYWLLGIYFLGVIGNTVWMLVRFRRSP